ncbi:MAG: hypothetical protein H3C27_07225 [Opitutaceae bacterium]|nr:hypothetical protein [Opitutaceae bacterium]
MPLNPTLARIRTQQDRAYGLLEGAAANKLPDDVNRLDTLVQILEDCEQQFIYLNQQLLASESALDALQYRPEEQSERHTIKVTQGMINQKILPFNRLVRKWHFREGQKIEIDFGGSVGFVKSEILPGTKALRARGVVGRFYREHGVKVGDILLLQQVNSHTWSIRRKTPYR